MYNPSIEDLPLIRGAIDRSGARSFIGNPFLVSQTCSVLDLGTSPLVLRVSLLMLQSSIDIFGIDTLPHLFIFPDED